MTAPQRIAVLGTGDVGRAIAGRLHDLGHDVAVGTRDRAATLARPEYAAWSAGHEGLTTSTFGDAAAGADVVVNASGGEVTLEVLHQAGAEQLAGTVLIDVSNPLDHSRGFPPRLSVCNDDSLAEQVQRAFPEARVVKTLNTMNNAVMVDPARLGSSSTVFVCGEDAGAKAVVTDLLTQLGHDDVLDLGGLRTARGAEMWLPLWISIAGALGSGDFNIKVVRG